MEVKDHVKQSQQIIGSWLSRAMMAVCAVLVGMVIYGNWPKSQPNTTPVPAAVNTPAVSVAARPQPKGYHALVELYVQVHSAQPERYWLKGDEDHAAHIALVQNWTNEAKASLARNQDLTPLTREIFAGYANFRVSEFRDGMAVTMFAGEFSPEEFEQMGMRPELVIVPSLQMRQYGAMFPSSLYFRPDWGAVTVVGIEIPAKFRAALLYHEFGHALRSAQGASSATAPSNSDGFIGEEMEMHELEHDVLNSETGGALEALFARIRARATDPRDPHSVLEAVEKDDLMEYDVLLGLETSGATLANVFLAQFAIGLGISTINADGVDVASRKIQLYRALTSADNHMRHVAALEGRN